MRMRSASPADAEAIEAIYRPIVLETAISSEWEPPSVKEFRARIEKVTAKYPWLVALDDEDAVAGFVYANTHRDAPSYQWSVNTSVFIRDDMHASGVGKALYVRLFQELQTLGYYRAFAGIALPNVASVALHESVGFQPIGVYEKVGFKFGQWRDVGWWKRQLQLHDTEPQPPRMWRP